MARISPLLAFGGGGCSAAAGVSDTSVVTGQTLGTAANGFTGFVGVVFTVGASPITVTSLGHWIKSGDSGTRTMYIGTGTDGGTFTTLGSVSVTSAGSGFVYTSLGSPVALSAGANYYVFAQETSGADFYYDGSDTTVTLTSAVLHFNDRYISGAIGSGLITVPGHTNENCYGPVSFLYH